jgi:hypothetical protein
MMKSQVSSLPLLLLSIIVIPSSCKKSQTGAIPSSLAFQTTTTTPPVTMVSVHFPVNVVAVQQVDTLNTTLISGSYGDTSVVTGSINIHVIGDTTLTYTGNKVLVTYVDGSGNTYNSAGDSSDVVTITRFPKTENGIVAGSFHVTVAGTAGSLTIAAGSFTVPFLD